MSYLTREAFGGWIRTTWLPLMSRLPKNEKPVFIEAFTDEFLALYPADDDGSIHIGMVRLEAEAKKGPEPLLHASKSINQHYSDRREH